MDAVDLLLKRDITHRGRVGALLRRIGNDLESAVMRAKFLSELYDTVEEYHKNMPKIRMGRPRLRRTA